MSEEKNVKKKYKFPKEIEVQFFTTTYPKKVTPSPFKVPSTLTRFGLSEIINHLLNNEKNVPFEFLIRQPKDNKKIILRSTLERYFTKNKLYPETALKLEYIEAQPTPKSIDSIPHDDWISSLSCSVLNVATKDGKKKKEFLLTGCYDGYLRLIDSNNGNILSTGKHFVPIVNHSVKNFGNNKLKVVTASRSSLVRVWSYDTKEGEKSKLNLDCVVDEHNGRIEDVDFNNKGNMVCCGSFDKNISLLNIEKKEKPELIGYLKGHKSAVTCLSWNVHNGELIYSGSNDHTIRIWDVKSIKNITTINCNKVFTSLAVNPFNKNLIISSHPDHLIRLWDKREKSNEFNMSSKFKSHKGWVRKVLWSQNDQYKMLSCGDDNMIKSWDIRSTLPLHSIKHHTKEIQKDEKRSQPHKVLCIGWSQLSKKRFYSGSTNCKLVKHSFK